MWNRNRARPAGEVLHVSLLAPLAWLGGLSAAASALVAFFVFLAAIFSTGTGAGPDAPSPWTDPATNIELFAPVANTIYRSPIDVTGLSRTFEGNVNIRLLDANGEVLAERNAIGGSVDGFDFFHTYLRFSITEEQPATLEVFEIDAGDGSRRDEVSIPITLQPGQRFVDMDWPEVGASICAPVLVSGYSTTFEANVAVDLRARDGSLLAQGNAMGGSMGIYADFSTSLGHEVTEPTAVLVSAGEISAKDGAPIDLARRPASLYPAGMGPCE